MLARYATLLRALCAGLQTHRVVVKHVPRWVPQERLLGDGAWVACEDGGWACELTTREACDVAAAGDDCEGKRRRTGGLRRILFCG